MIVNRILSRSGGAARRFMSSAPALQLSALDNNVSLLQMDDGKMNAFSSDVITHFHSILDDAEDAGALVIAGTFIECMHALTLRSSQETRRRFPQGLI